MNALHKCVKIKNSWKVSTWLVLEGRVRNDQLHQKKSETPKTVNFNMELKISTAGSNPPKMNWQKPWCTSDVLQHTQANSIWHISYMYFCTHCTHICYTNMQKLGNYSTSYFTKVHISHQKVGIFIRYRGGRQIITSSTVSASPNKMSNFK